MAHIGANSHSAKKTASPMNLSQMTKRSILLNAFFANGRASSLLRQQSLVGLLIALLLSFVTSSTAQAAVTATTATINGQTSITTYTGASHTVSVTVTRSGFTDYDGTSYRFGNSGLWTCVDTPNNSDAGTDTETINITAPGSTGNYTLYVRGHNNSSCGEDSGDVSPTPAQISFNVQNPDFTTTTATIRSACLAWM